MSNTFTILMRYHLFDIDKHLLLLMYSVNFSYIFGYDSSFSYYFLFVNIGSVRIVFKISK